jgi:hypothetical protein
VITRDEMLKGNYVTVYDAVAARRSMWLQPRGPDSFVLPSIVWVYIDGARAGGVEILRNMQPRLVNTVRFYDGPSATSRWGVDNGAGVIHISTWSEGAPGIPIPDSTRRRPKPAARSLETLRLPKLFADGMVIQRGVAIPVWGWAASDAQISVRLGRNATRTTADSLGHWNVRLPAMSAGGPYEMSVEAGDARLQVRDILVGDVWVASGQSNMEWTVSVSANAAQ